MDPKTFSVNSWPHPGWTNIHLKHITKGQFRNVVQSAWRNVAPKRLVASYDAKDRGCAQRAASGEAAALGIRFQEVSEHA
jgi:hypothetical protein